MLYQVNAAHRLLAETLDEYVKRLGTLGVRRLGGGGFAYVFQHPTLPNVAVKLLHAEDPGYMAYAKFCQTLGKNNPYCPKILQVAQASKVFDDIDDPSLTLVFTEKLTPVSNQEYMELAKRLRAFTGVGGSVPQVMLLELVNSTYFWRMLAKQTVDTNMAQLAQFVTKTVSGYIELDLHKGNVMKRGTQLVIIDPFSSWG